MILTPIGAWLLNACSEDAQPAKAIAEKVAQRGHPLEMHEDGIIRCLEQLCQAGLLQGDGKYRLTQAGKDWQLSTPKYQVSHRRNPEELNRVFVEHGSPYENKEEKQR